jgi:glycosyltransferase involved in cell wall biosynthesis
MEKYNLKLKPLVSIIINNYNYESYLPDAINSALNQTYAHTEVIVVDDGSTDSSHEIIQSYGNKIVSIIKENGGQSSAINAGFSASSGEIICLLDADDLFLPEKVSYVVDFFQNFPDIDWFFTESAPLKNNEMRNVSLLTLFQEIREKSIKTDSEKIDFRKSIKSGKIPNFTPSMSNLCFSRRVMKEISPLPEVRGISGRAITDLYIHSLAVGLGTGCFTKQYLGIYRLHEVNNMYAFHELNATSLSLAKRRRQVAEKNMATGYWIQNKFPEFRSISNKFLSKGFATYLSSIYPKCHKVDVDCDVLLKSYLAEFSLVGQLEILSMIFYYWIKLRFKKLV